MGSIQAPFGYVVQGSCPTLLGRDWLSCIPLVWTRIRVVVLGMATPGHLIKKYQDVFEPGTGTMIQLKAHLSLKEQVKSRFCKPRPVPFAIRKEQDHLEESGVLCRVDYSEWDAPIVPMPKKDGAIRICGDYRVTINPFLRIDQYPLPKPSDLMACLTDGKRFSKLDLDR